VTWLEVKEAGAALPVALPVLLVAAVLWDKLLHATAAVAAIASTAAEIIARFFLACFMAILRLSCRLLDFIKPASGLSLARVSESASAL
jgi:hypothetical protein